MKPTIFVNNDGNIKDYTIPDGCTYCKSDFFACTIDDQGGLIIKTYSDDEYHYSSHEWDFDKHKLIQKTIINLESEINKASIEFNILIERENNKIENKKKLLNDFRFKY